MAEWAAWVALWMVALSLAVLAPAVWLLVRWVKRLALGLALAAERMGNPPYIWSATEPSYPARRPTRPLREPADQG